MTFAVSHEPNTVPSVRQSFLTEMSEAVDRAGLKVRSPTLSASSSSRLTLARSCQAGIGLLGGRAASFSGSWRRRAACRAILHLGRKRRAALLVAVFGRLAAQAKDVRRTMSG